MSITGYLEFHPEIGVRAFVHESAQVIGEVRIGDDSSIWCNAVLRGDVNHIHVGRCTNIQDFTIGHVSHRSEHNPVGTPLVIGDYVTVGHSVIIHGATIGNNCLIGMGAILMDDVVIQDNVLVGADHDARSGFWSDLLSLPRSTRDEIRLRDRATAALDELGVASYDSSLQAPPASVSITSFGSALARIRKMSSFSVGVSL